MCSTSSQVYHSDCSTVGPNSVGVLRDFEIIRECMKTNKIHSKFHFLTKLEIKMTHSVFLLCFFFSVSSLLSRAIWRPFYWYLRFWVVLTRRNKGRRLWSVKPTVPARSSINPLKMVQTHQNCRQRIVDSLSFPSMLVESQISPKPLAKCFGFKIFPQEFSFFRCIWPGYLTWCNQWLLKAYITATICPIQEWARCIPSGMVGGSLGTFDYDKACQNIMPAPCYLHSRTVLFIFFLV